jgi:hypothetical protein
VTAAPDAALEAPRPHRSRPYRREALKRYAIATLTTAAIIFAIGWWTDLRQVMHGAMLTVAAIAFLPLVLIAAGLLIALICIAISILAALLTKGESGDGVVTDAGLAELGVSIAPGYYRFLFARFVARRRHPVFWGVPSGLLLGGLALWLLIAAVIVPREVRTAETLADAKRRIEQHYADRRRYPAPTPAGHLRRADLGLPGEDVVRDAFGRPVEYRTSGAWKVASYTLRSDGFDGRPGKDDLHASGATALGAVARGIDIERDGGNLSIRVRLQRMRDAKKEDP